MSGFVNDDMIQTLNEISEAAAIADLLDCMERAMKNKAFRTLLNSWHALDRDTQEALAETARNAAHDRAREGD